MEGYRKVLSRNIPETVAFALKWNESKTKWVDYVYNTWLKHLVTKKDKTKTTNDILGKGKKYGFVFSTTIAWDGLTDEEKEYWNSTNNWVLWFQKNFITVHGVYKMYKAKGKSEGWIQDYIERIHLLDIDESLRMDLAKYLIKCIKTCQQK